MGGREKRPRNGDRLFEKVLVSGLRVRKMAGKSRTISGGGSVWLQDIRNTCRET
jgi:hypothetical protein